MPEIFPNSLVREWLLNYNLKIIFDNNSMLSRFAHAKNNTVHLGLKGKFGGHGFNHIERHFSMQ